MAAMFSVRVVTTEHYLADPIPGLDVTQCEFRGTEVKKVPILRIFGSTPAGQKTCLHVHGVFPYLYVPYDGTDPWERYLRQFAASLDKAINIANNTKSNPQHVHKLSLVTGIPMYGYHAKEQEFIKIYLYNPTSVKKAADLLLAGAVMSKPFQPYEAHIPYHLQLFIDFNLYGMNLINAGAVKFRRKKDHGKKKSKQTCSSPAVLSTSTLDCTADCGGGNTPSLRKWDPDNIPEEMYLPYNVPRQSSSELEADIVAADILNRLEVGSNIGTNPGLAALWEDEKQRRRDQGQDSQITPPQSQDHGEVKTSESETNYHKRLQEIIEEQKSYISSQSEPSDGETSQDEGTQSGIAATPASLVEIHQSQDTDSVSQHSDTVEEDPPVVSLESIQRVLSFSQSFSQPSPPEETTADISITDVLASLAKESSPASSQLTPSQLSALEDEDSVMADVVPDAELLERDEEETLEMSQRVWDGADEEMGEDKSPSSITAVEYDVQGIDDTWDSSLELPEEQESADSVIPQLDGASDEKPESKRPKKRLGVRGPVLSPQYESTSYQAPHSYGREYSTESGYAASAQDTASVQRLGNPNPDYSHQWNQDSQNPSGHRSQPQYQNWQHSTWQQSPVNVSNNFQTYYNHPQSSESNFRYSSYPIHSPDSSGYVVHSPSYNVNTSSHFSGTQGIGVASQDSYQQMMQFGSENMGAHEYTNTKGYSHASGHQSSGQCSETNVNLGSSHELMSETERYGQMVGTLTSSLQHTDMATTVTDLDTLQTCISPSSTMSRAISGSDSSQQDLFGSPHDVTKGRSMSLDENSHSECLMDLSDCRGFMPESYKSISTDNLCTDINLSSSFLPSALTVNKEGSYPSSAMSGLFNLVSNISEGSMYEATSKQTTGKRHLTKLSLKRSRSCSSTVSDSKLDCASGWRAQSESLTNVWNVSDFSGYSPETGLPVFSNRTTESWTGGRSSSNQTSRSKLGKSKSKTRCRLKTVCSQPVPKDAAYTYAFHVPTPVFKRLKLHQKDVQDKVKVVRMHPKDARKYSLLKIGREVVEVQKLSTHDILKYSKCHSDTADIEHDAMLAVKDDHVSLTSPKAALFGSIFERNSLVAEKPNIDSSTTSPVSAVSDRFIGNGSLGEVKPEGVFVTSSVVSSSSSITENCNLIANKQTGESPPSVAACPTGGIIASLLLGIDEAPKTQSQSILHPKDTDDRQSGDHQKKCFLDKEHFQEYVKIATASLEVAEKATKLETMIEKKIETIINPHKISPEIKQNTDFLAGKPLGPVKKTSDSNSFSAAFEQFVMANLSPEDKKKTFLKMMQVTIVKNNVGKQLYKNEMDKSDKLESVCCVDEDKSIIANTEKSRNQSKMPDNSSGREGMKPELMDWQQDGKIQSLHVENTPPHCQTGHCPVSPIKSDSHQEHSHHCNPKPEACDSLQEDLFDNSSPNDATCTTPHGCNQDDVSQSGNSEEDVPLVTQNQCQSDSGNNCDSFNNCSPKNASQDEHLHCVLPAGLNCNQQNSSNGCSPKHESIVCNPEDISHCCDSDFSSSKDDQENRHKTGDSEITSCLERESGNSACSTQVCGDTLSVDLTHKTQGDTHPLETSNVFQEQIDDLTLRNNFILDDVTSLKGSSEEEKVRSLFKDSINTEHFTTGVFHDLKTKPVKLDAEFLESEREQLSEAESAMSNAQSRTSSRTSSRKESSDSNECVFEDVFVKQPHNKKHIQKRVDTISECSDSNLELHDMYFDSYSLEIRRKRTAANYSPNAFSHLFKVGKPNETKPDTKKKKTRKTDQKLILGVHYIIVGKFKGYKSMGVKLKRLNMGIDETVSVTEYLDRHKEEKEFMKKATVKALQKFRFKGSSLASNENHMLEDNSLTEKTDKHSLQKMSKKSHSKSVKCLSDMKENNSFDSSSATSSHSECDNHNLSFTETSTVAVLVSDDISTSDMSRHQSTGDMSASDISAPLDSTDSDKEGLISLQNIKKSIKTKHSTLRHTVSFDDMDQCFDSNSDVTFNMKMDRHNLSLKKKPPPPADGDRVELTTTIDKKIFPSSYQTAEKIEMFSKDIESDTALATGSTAFISGDHSEFFDSSNSNDSNSNFGQSCFKSKTLSPPHEASAPSAVGQANNSDRKKSTRKKLTRNQKLGVAFLSTRRKKKANKDAGKLMNSLSLLHQATLESLVVDKSTDLPSDAGITSDTLKMSENINVNPDCGNKDVSGNNAYPGGLGDDSICKEDNSIDLFQTSNSNVSFSGFSRQTYTDKTDDYEVTFDDTMYKLALFSPPLSDLGEVSPPVPLSPVELASYSPKIPLSTANTCTKLMGTSPTFEKNGIQYSTESIYETPLSSVENQKDLSNMTDVKVVDHTEGGTKTSRNLKVSTHSSDGLSSTSDISPLKTAVVKLSPMMLSDISNLNAQWRDRSTNEKCPDSMLYSNNKHDSVSNDPCWQDCSQNVPMGNSQRQNVETCQHIADDIDVIENPDRQNLERQYSKESDFSYHSCPKIDSVTSLSDNWLHLSECPQTELVYDPYSNPIKDPQYDDISSDEDTAEPADGEKSKDKGSASTKSSVPSKSAVPIKTVEADNSRNEGLPSSDAHLQSSIRGGGMSDDDAGKLVICPQVLPPSRKMVGLTAAAHGLGSVQATRAFCSNPADLPGNPRLLGGPQSKLQSVLVKDLPDFRSSTSETLLSWRQQFVTKTRIFSSQTNIEPLWEKLQKDPDFKYILTEDKHCVLTPCRPPPCKKQIQKWLNGKQLVLKHVTKNEGDRTMTESDSNTTLDVCVDKLKTSRKQKLSEQDSSMDVYDDSTLVDNSANTTSGQDHPASQVVRDSSVYDGKQTDSAMDTDRPCVQIIHMKGTLSSGNLSTDVKKEWSPNDKNRNGKSRWDQTEGHDALLPRHQQTDTMESSVLHSTPHRHKSSRVVFEPSCSPIDSGQRKSKHRKCDNRTQEQAAPEEKDFTLPKTVHPPQSTSREASTPLKPAPTAPSVNRQPSLQKSAGDAQLKTPLRTSTSKGSNVSQIDGPTPKNTCGFKYTQQNMQNAKAIHEYQYLTLLSMELHVETRGDLRPDPEVDSIQVLFYSILNDVPPSEGDRWVTGLIIVDKTSAQQDVRVLPGQCDPGPDTGGNSSLRPSMSSPKPSTSSHLPSTSSSSSAASPSKSHQPSPTSKKHMPTLFQKSGVSEKNVCYVMSEEELIDSFITLIARWDPDILVGYEIQMLSWGYIIQRSSHLGVNLYTKLSRIPDTKESKHYQEHNDDWGAAQSSEIHVTGRIVLNLWRLLRHEVTLNIYSFENVAFHVLHQRLPAYSFRTLSLWYGNRLHHNRWRVVEYYLKRVKANIEIIDQLDLVGKTSEFARVFGIEFFDVLSRGSQYRVESMMLRLAKPMNFIPVSPSVQQRARMRAGECIPLTLEPKSQFYMDPVVVLDFQSLYPSIMIAYNYCFSTCLGRLECLANAQDGPFEFGCTSLNIKPSLLKKLGTDVTVSPNGVVFVKQNVRHGILPKMVEEILNTRLMVKKSLKTNKADKVLSRLLDARQLGLKLIANVTYGYTGASFSGRMPCIEVGDSIVRKARESLELSIKLVEDTPHWRAKVVYGDTDSMFILLKGRSKDEAFVVGQEIADAVTNMFPKPMKLKFEKVYLPCVLQTKKRYVGFMYENPDQKDPVYDAKGIETVRRDACAAVSKVLERSIKLLFTSRDMSQVKQYVQRQCNKLMEGKVSIQDCVFAKEYRGMAGYKPGACVPALEIARKLLRQDRRGEPRVSERVPYVIVYGSPGLPLIQLVRQPLELLRDPTLRINGVYYITKQILPPLGRMFSLLGIDVFTWYQEIPRVIRFVPQSVVGADNKKGTISQYFVTTNCPICDEQSKQPICPTCLSDCQMTAVTLMENTRLCARVHDTLGQVCYNCMGSQDATQPCISTDCSILFRRVLAHNDNNKAEYHRQMLEKALEF
ncbi:LOW QUALITY PROTEIN: uncharacterized protein LOC121371842 [Gigantopelta aegis]|uniref:LOW QUALITY PROTEIN: uncharacterized protein LOC121371842 n=1 Tax=Gigantopelta aegis TaxID=1735272 RepID=UPI001B888C65|nr:LOW QUALITY PROTEIN: uncharacterized protein LOC121371842 [Gigantopelta aegis]